MSMFVESRSSLALGRSCLVVVVTCREVAMGGQFGLRRVEAASGGNGKKAAVAERGT